MRKIKYVLLALVVIGVVAFVLAKPKKILAPDHTQNPAPPSGPVNVDMANPASKFCIDKGYKSEIRTNPDGSQSGYCVFSDGSECSEWAFFRGECGEGK